VRGRRYGADPFPRCTSREIDDRAGMLHCSHGTSHWDGAFIARPPRLCRRGRSTPHSGPGLGPDAGHAELARGLGEGQTTRSSHHASNAPSPHKTTDANLHAEMYRRAERDTLCAANGYGGFVPVNTVPSDGAFFGRSGGAGNAATTAGTSVDMAKSVPI
jgi:hypothetical protein